MPTDAAASASAMPVKVGYQGEPGAYSEGSAYEAFRPTAVEMLAVGY